MKLIESKVELIEQQPGLDGVYKQIELAGRTCYKSEDKITEDSAKAFVDRMIKSKHGAMLEHGTVYLKITYPLSDTLSKEEFDEWFDGHRFDYMLGYALRNNKYTKTRTVEDDTHETLYITTNMRVLCTNTFNSLPWGNYICEPTEHHVKRITARFTCDRGVSHEIVRHRVMSFAQESTRYCNYGKDKFGNEVTFIKPTWYNIVSDEQKEAFDDFLSISEEAYMALLDKWENRTPDKRYKTKFKGNPLTPQQARQVLPNALKTEIIVTGFESDWEHFFSLRSPKAGAQGAHPDIAKLADELYEKLNSVNK